jgi:hypothetical protein
MPQLTRRSVLALGAGATGAAALVSVAGATPAFAAAAPAAAAATASLTRAHFKPGLHAVFTATLAKRVYQLTLSEIVDLPHAAAKHSNDCFSLVFATRAADNPAEGIYTLQAKGVAATTLFLSKTTLASGKRQLQAVVNRAQ